MPFPSPGDLPDPGNETKSPASQADSLQPEPPRVSGDTEGSGPLKSFPIYLWSCNEETTVLKNYEVFGGEKDWESVISRGKLVYIGWINNKVLLNVCEC